MTTRSFFVDASRTGGTAASRALAVSPSERLLRAWRRLCRLAHDTGRYLAARRQIGVLDERMLKDIGLNRGDVPNILREQRQQFLNRFHL